MKPKAFAVAVVKRKGAVGCVLVAARVVDRSAETPLAVLLSAGCVAKERKGPLAVFLSAGSVVRKRDRTDGCVEAVPVVLLISAI